MSESGLVRRLSGSRVSIRVRANSPCRDRTKPEQKFAWCCLSGLLPCKWSVMTKLRLLIVDDEPLIRSGLRRELAKIAEIEIAGECEDGRSAIAAIAAK